MGKKAIRTNSVTRYEYTYCTYVHKYLGTYTRLGQAGQRRRTEQNRIARRKTRRTDARAGMDVWTNSGYSARLLLLLL
jgi:hypothetical protein